MWDVDQCPERFLGIISQNPSAFKFDRLHVVIFPFSLLIAVYSIDSLHALVIFLKS